MASNEIWFNGMGTSQVLFEAVGPSSNQPDINAGFFRVHWLAGPDIVEVILDFAESDNPGMASAVADRLTELQALRATTDDKRFVKGFLNEVIRTYSGVWGVTDVEVHETTIFESIEEFSSGLATHPDRHRIITELLAAPPGELYEMLSTQSVEEVTDLYCSAR